VTAVSVLVATKASDTHASTHFIYALVFYSSVHDRLDFKVKFCNARS
jgi:hypothetical protein